MKPSYQRLQEQGPPVIPGVPLYHDYEEDFTSFSSASLVERIFAVSIDVVMYGPLSLLIQLPFSRQLEYLHSFGQNIEYGVLSALLFFIPYFLYVLVPTALYGQTLGKYIVGLRVIRRDYGAGVNFADVLLREVLGKFLNLLSLGGGVLLALTDREKRMLHDRMAQTVVISYRRR